MAWKLLFTALTYKRSIISLREAFTKKEEQNWRNLTKQQVQRRFGKFPSFALFVCVKASLILCMS